MPHELRSKRFGAAVQFFETDVAVSLANCHSIRTPKYLLEDKYGESLFEWEDGDRLDWTGVGNARGIPNDFHACLRPLLIPATDLDRAERVVFGIGALADTPVSEAIAASSAIPGFFEPFRIGDRDFIDGDVGHTGHADLAVQAGADLVVVVNPLVPLRTDARAPALRAQGLYGILEQVGRINSQSLLELGLRELALRHPKVEIHLVQPPALGTPLFGPSMGFEASRQALRFGHDSVGEWLAGGGAALRRRFGSVPRQRAKT